MLASVLLATVTVPVTIAIGVVFIVAGVVYMVRRKMLLGVVLLIIGMLLGGLNIFGIFDFGAADEILAVGALITGALILFDK
ncbi:MAG: hypothetical protein ABIJ48_05220 [Actinomycetota bacterium]